MVIFLKLVPRGFCTEIHRILYSTIYNYACKGRTLGYLNVVTHAVVRTVSNDPRDLFVLIARADTDHGCDASLTLVKGEKSRGIYSAAVRS